MENLSPEEILARMDASIADQTPLASRGGAPAPAPSAPPPAPVTAPSPVSTAAPGEDLSADPIWGSFFSEDPGVTIAQPPAPAVDPLADTVAAQTPAPVEEAPKAPRVRKPRALHPNVAAAVEQAATPSIHNWPVDHTGCSGVGQAPSVPAPAPAPAPFVLRLDTDDLRAIREGVEALTLRPAPGEAPDAATLERMALDLEALHARVDELQTMAEAIRQLGAAVAACLQGVQVTAEAVAALQKQADNIGRALHQVPEATCSAIATRAAAQRQAVAR